MQLDREYLLGLVLAWYAGVKTWERPVTIFANRRETRSAADDDRGRKARAALRESSIGGLLRAACDAWDVHLTELARRSGMDGARMSQIVLASDVTEKESSAIRAALDQMLEGSHG